MKRVKIDFFGDNDNIVEGFAVGLNDLEELKKRLLESADRVSNRINNLHAFQDKDINHATGTFPYFFDSNLMSLMLKRFDVSGQKYPLVSELPNTTNKYLQSIQVGRIINNSNKIIF